MAKKRTPMQELYFKQISRLKKGLQRWARKLGISVNKDVIPDMPNRVTKKRLEEIKNIKPKQLVNSGTQLVDPDTGEILTPQQYTRLPKAEQAQFFDYNSAIFRRYYENLNQYNEEFTDKMENWIDGLRAKYGDDAVAQMLQDGAENGVVVVYTMAYSQEKMLEYIAEMLEYLPDAGPLEREQILTAIEEDEYFPTTKDEIPDFWRYEE